MTRALPVALSLLFLMLVAVPSWAQMTILESNGDLYQLPLDCSQVQTITFADGFAELRCSGADASIGQDYVDGQNNVVHVPCGEMAFADSVVAYDVGSPAPSASIRIPQRVLGEPDFVQDQVAGDLTLGCGGSVTVAFSRVFLVDAPGTDLHVFEVGPAVEPSRVEISADGVNWIDLGRVEGGKASIDIASFVRPGERFSYVRITDLRSHCEGEWPGADIDAVAAVGCTPR